LDWPIGASQTEANGIITWQELPEAGLQTSDLHCSSTAKRNTQYHENVQTHDTLPKLWNHTSATTFATYSAQLIEFSPLQAACALEEAWRHAFAGRKPPNGILERSSTDPELQVSSAMRRSMVVLKRRKQKQHPVFTRSQIHTLSFIA